MLNGCIVGTGICLKVFLFPQETKHLVGPLPRPPLSMRLAACTFSPSDANEYIRTGFRGWTCSYRVCIANFATDETANHLSFLTPFSGGITDHYALTAASAQPQPISCSHPCSGSMPNYGRRIHIDTFLVEEFPVGSFLSRPFTTFLFVCVQVDGINLFSLLLPSYIAALNDQGVSWLV